jgi:hypothetical protein
MTDSMWRSSVFVDADVARDEFGRVLELAERPGGLHQHEGAPCVSVIPAQESSASAAKVKGFCVRVLGELLS